MNIFPAGLLRDETKKRGDEIILKGKPIGNFFAIEIVKGTHATLFKKVLVLTSLAFLYDQAAFAQFYFLQYRTQSLLQLCTEITILFDLIEERLHVGRADVTSSLGLAPEFGRINSKRSAALRCFGSSPGSKLRFSRTCGQSMLSHEF